MKSSSRNYLKPMIGLVLIAFFIYLFRFSPFKNQLTLDSIQLFLQSAGPWGPLIYIILYVGLTVVFFPASILTVAGGFAFGIFFGTVYAIIAATLSAAIAFYAGRYLAKDWVEKTFGKTFESYNKKLSDHGFQTVAIMRLLFLPYIPLSYAAGASRVSIGAFILATFLTNIPGGFAFAYLGTSFTDPRTLIAAILLVLLVLLIPKITKKLTSRS